MIDREKVIKALKCRKDADNRCGNPCEYTGFCHYAKAIRGSDGEIYLPYICDRERICADSLALLEEQEAVKPKLVGESMWRCGKCEALLGWEDFTPSGIELVQYKFCPECGKKVKWE